MNEWSRPPRLASLHLPTNNSKHQQRTYICLSLCPHFSFPLRTDGRTDGRGSRQFVQQVGISAGQYLGMSAFIHSLHAFYYEVGLFPLSFGVKLHTSLLPPPSLLTHTLCGCSKKREEDNPFFIATYMYLDVWGNGCVCMYVCMYVCGCV
jgi:hypothetical protein